MWLLISSSSSIPGSHFLLIRVAKQEDTSKVAQVYTGWDKSRFTVVHMENKTMRVLFK